MTINVTEKEYNAISFATCQIETTIEAADDESFIEDANNCLQCLYDIMEKFKAKNEKVRYFQAVRAEVSKRYRGKLRPRDIDKLTRNFIKSEQK